MLALIVPLYSQGGDADQRVLRFYDQGFPWMNIEGGSADKYLCAKI